MLYAPTTLSRQQANTCSLRRDNWWRGFLLLHFALMPRTQHWQLVIGGDKYWTHTINRLPLGASFFQLICNGSHSGWYSQKPCWVLTDCICNAGCRKSKRRMQADLLWTALYMIVYTWCEMILFQWYFIIFLHFLNHLIQYCNMVLLYRNGYEDKLQWYPFYSSLGIHILVIL